MIEPALWRGWGPAVAVGLVAGALVGSALAAPSYYGIIMVLGHIIILTTRVPIMLLRQKAITLLVTALHRARMRLPIACGASNHTIRGPEPISGQTVTASRAPKARRSGVPAIMPSVPLRVTTLIETLRGEPRRLENEVFVCARSPRPYRIDL